MIRSIRSDFTNQGVDEQVLTDLQAAWESKLLAANIFPSSSAVAISSGMPGGSSAMAMPMRQQMPQDLGALTAIAGLAGQQMPLPTSQQQHMQLQHHLLQLQRASGVGQPRAGQHVAIPRVSVAYLAQQQKTSGMSYFQSQESLGSSPTRPAFPQPSAAAAHLEQDKKEEAAASDGGIEHSPRKPSKKSTAANRDGNDELNSDLDSSDSSDDAASEGDDLDENIVLCLYEKVSRTRNRWRAVFRAGSAHINGVDYAFNRQSAEFEF